MLDISTLSFMHCRFIQIQTNICTLLWKNIKQIHLYLDVNWNINSASSSFGSIVLCIVAHPIRSGSSKPTSRTLISTPCFCLGFESVGHARSTRSFKKPTNAAKTNPVFRSYLYYVLYVVKRGIEVTSIGSGNCHYRSCNAIPTQNCQCCSS